jgi:hypothetical protein
MFWFGLGALSLVVAILAAAVFAIYVIFDLLGELFWEILGK